MLRLAKAGPLNQRFSNRRLIKHQPENEKRWVTIGTVLKFVGATWVAKVGLAPRIRGYGLTPSEAFRDLLVKIDELGDEE